MWGYPVERRLIGVALAGTMAAGLPLAGAQAGGYGVGYESVVATSLAGAGGGAAAGDASTSYFNPAGMMLLDRTQLTTGAHLIIPEIEFTNRGTRSRNGVLVPGNNGGDGGEDAAVPHLYGVWAVKPNTRLGLSINSPYGLVTSWDGGFVGRYNEITTSLKTFNVNPSVAFQLSPQLSFGMGASAVYGRARLSQGIDFGAALGLGDTTQDGAGEINVDDISYGFNFGAMYQFKPDSRIGVAYRSQVKFDFEGDVTFQVPAAARAALNGAGLPRGFRDGGASVTLPLPEQISISGYHRLNSKWAFMGDVTWTQWSEFDQLRINFDETQTSSNVINTRWNNTLRYAAGATYEWSPKIQLRAGAHYDDSPIDANFRGVGVPDTDRIATGIGAGYKLNDRTSIDFAYQHLFFKGGVAVQQNGANSRVNGQIESKADILGLGVTVKF